MSHAPTVSDIIPELTREKPGSRILKLSLAGLVLGVMSNEPKILEGLADYFGVFVCKDDMPEHMLIVAIEGPAPTIARGLVVKQPDPGKNKIKEEYLDLADGRLVRKRLTGMCFAFGGDLHWAVGPCLANLNQVINFVNNRQIQWELDRGALLAHAAAVAKGDSGLALAGFSGMGKSTLSLHLMSAGLTFVSNDRLLFRREGGQTQMMGVPKLPRINPGTALNNPDLATVMPPEDRETFSRLTGSEIWDLEHKYDVDIEGCFGGDRFHLEADMAALGILNWQRDGQPLTVRQVDLSQRLDLLAAFEKEPGLFFLTPSPVPDYGDQAYLRELAGVKVFELTGGINFQAAVDELMSQLGWKD